MVGLDVADRAFQVGAAAQRAVHDQQVVTGRVLGAEGERELHLGAGEPPLQRERELIEPGALGDPGRVARGRVRCLSRRQRR